MYVVNYAAFSTFYGENHLLGSYLGSPEDHNTSLFPCPTLFYEIHPSFFPVEVNCLSLSALVVSFPILAVTQSWIWNLS